MPAGSGTDWTCVEDGPSGASSGRPVVKYWITEEHAKAMAFNAPNRALGDAFRRRLLRMEREFRDFLVSQMEETSRKRAAAVEVALLELAERRAALKRQELDNVERAKTMMGSLDGRDELFFKDRIRDAMVATTAKESSDALALPVPVVKEWPLSQYLLEHGFRRLTLSELRELGKHVAMEYRERHCGNSPPTRESYVDGAMRRVYHYTERDAECIERGIQSMDVGKRQRRRVDGL